MIKPEQILNDRYKILPFSDGTFYKSDGMGIIYLAEDLTDHQKVILKKGRESHEVFNAGLNNEIALLKKLHHPGIPHFIDAFPIDDAMVLVIEFIEGENLEEISNREKKPISFEKLLDWGIEILIILEYLHKFTPPMIHRDIKPRNIMLGNDGFIKLIDFGISKDSLRTIIGGKSPWSPPEQFYEWGGTNERSDIFSLGATLYWLATKHLALPSKYRVQVMNDKLPDPLPTVAALNTNLPESFSKLIMTAMEINPDRRFQSAWGMKIEMIEEKKRLAAVIKTQPSPDIRQPKPEVEKSAPLNYRFTTPMPSPVSPPYPNSPVDNSELEEIQLLESKQTNFIFFFGQVDTGKTAIIASLINYLKLECRFGTFEKKGSEKEMLYSESIEQSIKQRSFPTRTTVGNLFQISGIFSPDAKHHYLEKLNLTFLDISGSDLSEISSTRSGKFPPQINVLFKSGKLSLTFILVVPVEDLKDSDKIMVEFIEFVKNNLYSLNEGRILLLVSKWDKTKTNIPPEYLLKLELPKTFAKLPIDKSYGVFTLGKIYEKEKELPFIQNYNSESAENVFRWIYFALTGKRIS